MTTRKPTPRRSTRGRRCPVDGVRFTPDRRNPGQVYCSVRCRMAAWRERRAGSAGTNSGNTAAGMSSAGSRTDRRSPE